MSAGKATPLRTIIVDDEPLARRLLTSLLEEIPEVELVAECTNGREAIAQTRALAPELLIMDIQMPGMTGFDVAKALQSEMLPHIVFCTAYQRYAVDAFDLHAVDYLLKPVDLDRLRRAVARTLQRRAETPGEGTNKALLLGAMDVIARNVSGSGSRRSFGGDAGPESTLDRKIAIKTLDSTMLVDIENIDWVDAAGDYMCVHVSGETHILRSTLKNLMKRLDDQTFRRIHRSTIVNLERIARVTPLKKGEYMLELDNGEQLKVSRNFRDAIKSFLSESQA